MQDNKLFYVGAKNSDGESLDLHVIEVDKQAATTLWREHYELDESDKPEFVGLIPGVVPEGAARAVPWGVINPS